MTETRAFSNPDPVSRREDPLKRDDGASVAVRLDRGGSKPPPNRFDPAVVPSIQDMAARYDRVALVLQGGGALGAYQAGVYEALSEAGADPDWISGVSIGAVNASIIAGNRPGDRLPRLREFWNRVSGRQLPSDHWPEGDVFRQWRNQISAWVTMTFGQPGFFQPRMPNPWLLPAGAPGSTSYYDTAQLNATLTELIDFDYLNTSDKRLSLGAVNVRTGNMVYFDSGLMKLAPEHVMASGALPPALPAVEIDGEHYWDGGIVSNTPLSYLMDQEEDKSSLVFQVDLFSARGELPRTMSDVLGRQKDITYSSRTRQNTSTFSRIHALKARLLDALQRVPESALREGERELIADYRDAGVVNIVHLIYQQRAYEGQAKDYEFSTTSMNEHWKAGYDDTRKTLRHCEWLEPPTTKTGIAVHDVHRDTLEQQR
jgi:NTE family protein